MFADGRIFSDADRSLSFSDILDDVLDGLSQRRIVFDILFDLLDGIDDGRIMSSAEFIADAFHGKGRQLSDDIDRNLTRLVDLRAA